MNLAPLTESSSVVIVHAIAAMFAIVLGGVQLFMLKGTATHKLLGKLWVGIMALVALSSFGIHDFRMLGPFSIIHLLSLLVLYSLWQGISQARQGNISAHKKTMVQLYILALLLTGLFTLYPGRVMYRVLFGA